MPASPLDLNGLSIGPFNQPNGSGQFASIVGTGSRPADRIAKAQQSIQTIGFLQYPDDLPKYYMGFQIYKYSRQSLLSVGLTEKLNEVALPFPDRMLDVNQVVYDKKAFTAAIGNVTNAGFKAVNAAKDSIESGGGIGGALKAAGGSLGTMQTLESLLGGLGASAATALAEETGQAIIGAAGYSPNYFLTVVLDGPQYKQYNLSWTFSPRTPHEAAQLTQVIRVFKDAMSPGLSGGGSFFNFPRVFQNYYAPNPGHLYQFRPSVLMNFAVDYTAGGMPAMRPGRPDSAGLETPVGIRVSAQFMELEFWLRGDFGDVVPGADGNQSSANQIQPLKELGDTT